MTQDPYLPPGCRISDIPGNRPVDEAYDRFMDDGPLLGEIIREIIDKWSDEELASQLYDRFEKELNDEFNRRWAEGDL